jgi:hypothetical protein
MQNNPALPATAHSQRVMITAFLLEHTFRDLEAESKIRRPDWLAVQLAAALRLTELEI